MKTIIVILERSENNYSAYIPDLDGCVATGETIDQVKEHIKEAVEFHLDGMKEEGLDIPEALQNDYNFVYKIDVESLFEWFSGVLTKSGIAKLTGMNQSLLSQYANGIKKPSKKQSKKIEKAIHNFGEELLSIQF
ncbi:MAG TPA: type II toxin-antitoxin system HicB family antitoxin [Bacteroidales bacterium]|jgi:predicted RNase H-like HicB family nuclease|nr:type II toxin-antitoxin system HicB family antitoxin [Bacteroidales bacterium]HOS72346.1 type II toxin-antitoxin system HicB family antitoxin [Bacteroidales bacterium]HQH24652.1 type II toxin-antitoxin system HicB family antitoxin [Bacteroidales bacterium]HQJ82911.1 type II toxin-antitoxin system HicB family antitoxin [Bacteroidales bacterium]